jgi:VWFA-related protein
MRHASHLRIVALAGLTALLQHASVFAQAPDQPTPDIKINVDRVNVDVVVTDSNGQFVQGLRREDFRVFDNGVPQPITDFMSVDEPAQVLLLVESGPAVYFLQGGHLRAVQLLLDGLSASDRVAIARYDERAELVLDLVGDKQIAAGALNAIPFNFGFGQLNLASSLLTALDWLAHVPGKKSLVLLSTGVDTSPPDAVQRLFDRLKTTEVCVLAVSLTGTVQGSSGSEKKSTKKNRAVDEKTEVAAEGIARANQELRSIAEANSGRAYFPLSETDFEQVLKDISQLIRHEYSLGFKPPSIDGKFHTINVTVQSSDANQSAPSRPAPYRVDHRRAYVAPGTGNE